MGTRSLTKVYDQFDGSLICTMYCQYDGYLSGVGADIKKCLQGINVVNGISSNTPQPFVNRMGKLAAYLVKNSDIDYEFQSNDKPCDWIDYTYHLKFIGDSEDLGKVLLTVESYGRTIYEGLLDEFDPDMGEDDE